MSIEAQPVVGVARMPRLLRALERTSAQSLISGLTEGIGNALVFMAACALMPLLALGLLYVYFAREG